MIMNLNIPENKSPLLKKVMEKGFDPYKKYSIKEIYGHKLQQSIGMSIWDVYAHRNSTGSKSNEKLEEYDHTYIIDQNGCRYLETNFKAWGEHPKEWDNDPIGTKYTATTLMEFYRPSLTDDFTFIGFSGGKNSQEKISPEIIRKYLFW